MSEHILDSDMRGIAAALRAGDTSSEALIDEAARRHDSYGAALGAYKYWDEDRARTEARGVDGLLASGYDAGALMGMPISLKDLYGVRGMPTFGGSPKELPEKWREEGPVTEALRLARGIIMGKTHTVEFAYGGVGTNSHWGAPVNPWDADNHRVTGGSSSGAGVSLCQGSALVAMGSDTGGSVRIPASVTGNVGLKVTIDRWSVEGIVPLSANYDTPGPLTRNVTDAILAFAAIDPAHRNAEEFFQQTDGAEVGNFNFALCDEHFWEDCGPGIAEGVRQAIDELSAKGARIGSVSLPEATMARESSLRGGIFGAEGQSFIEEHYPDRLDTLDPNVAERFAAGRDITAIDFLKAIRRIAGLAKIANNKLRHIDALITPTVPVAPPTVEQVADVATYKHHLGHMTQNTHPVNLLGLCAITLPVALDGAGMPVGLQLIAAAGREERLLSVALAVEKVLGTARQRIGVPPRCPA
ncbi:MAG: amidase [Rhodospirillaceae bacterium]|nr:amidase [Rhodospirillaceae bacterium]MBT3926968.1 amidase [Rhodospirillaceae bacterium]MBT6829725.1 amidase [Rhodospirillaceae bacterium]MBT7291281.1 amidase [Rhodospirillaceae bacterium]